MPCISVCDGFLPLLVIPCLKYFVVVFPFFHAALHWRPTVILQLGEACRPFSTFVLSYWCSPNLQQRFGLLIPRSMPWHTVLLNFFPFLLKQPSRSSSISHVMYRPSLLQMPSKILLAANFKAQLLEMKSVKVKSQTQLWVNASKWTPLLLFSLLFSAADFCLAGFLPSRQIITSVHFIICLSVLWCDTDQCVTWRRDSVVPEEELSAGLTSIYVLVVLCWWH